MIKIPEFSPTDADGFRTFSLYNPHGAEIMRVAVHLDNYQQYLFATEPESDKYTPTENKGVTTAAVLSSGKQGASFEDARIALLRAISVIATENMEKYFPLIAKVALQVATDACVKDALNRTVTAHGGPQIYDESAVDLLINKPDTDGLSLRLVVNELLGVQRGRPAETWERLQRTGGALKSLRCAQQDRTKENVADKLGINVRTLSTWHDDCGLTWAQWLRAAETAMMVKVSETEGN